MRLGVVNFLNAWPLWGALENSSAVTLVPDIPSRLVAYLREGKVDAALISSIEFFRLGKGYTYHKGVCVGAKNRVASIRFFTADASLSFRETLTRLNIIYTDAASRSSVAQLKVILKELGINIPFQEIDNADEKIPQLAKGEGLIAIGDTALAHRTRLSFDVQQEYYSLFKRGFVYALWAYPTALQNSLDTLFTTAYKNYLANEEQLLKEAIRRFGFDADFTQEYLTKIIQHTLTPERANDLFFFVEKHKNI
ncbi:MAG TPA: hypothetical protein PLY93_00630 [Turneriella sp.]|nr:hypothetical protein [Turneriella sp.]